MKASQKFRSPHLSLALLIFILVVSSCNKEKTETKEEAINMSPYEMASSEYVEIVEQTLTAWANQDFDAWGEYLEDDVIFYGSRGTYETIFEINENGKAEEVAFWKKWVIAREVENIKFTDASHIALKVKESDPFYNNSGTIVLSYMTQEITIFGKPTRSGVSYLFHFNSEKLIDKWYLFYDVQQQLDAIYY